MDYNGSPNGEDAFFFLGKDADEFYRIDVFGTDEEDTCVYSAADYSPDGVLPDAFAFVRRELPTPQRVDRLLAITIRMDEGLE
jgi:hypothetical protein